MKMRALLAGLLMAAACHKPPKDGGLIADIRIDAATQVTCVELSITDVDGKPLTSKRFPRDGKSELKLGIAQAGDPNLPADVKIRAQGLWSVDGCTEPAKPNASPADQQGHFTAGTVTQVDFTLRPPGPTDDADGDGYTGATSGGPDCDDTQRGTNPGAAEACTMAADLNCNGRIGCDDPACAGMACVRPAARLAFAGVPPPAIATRCSMAIVIESRDDQGQAAPVQANTPVTLQEQGALLGLQFFSDSGCTLPATSRDIPKGMTQVSFYARTATAGMTRLEATASGFASAQQDYRVDAGPPTSIVFKSAPQSVKSDACSQGVVLEARDMSNNPAPVPGDVAVTLTANPMPGFALFSDASCSAALTMPRIMSGAASLTFYFKPSRMPGTVTLAAAATGLGTAMQTETVVPGDPTRIVFSTAAQRVTAGACSTALTLKLQDAQLTDTTAPMALTLSLTGPTMTFFSAAGCSPATTVTSAQVPAGAGTVTVYFTATGAGMPLVTATGAGLMLATQMETVDPGPPVKLAFATGPQGIGTTQCSGAVRLTTQDQFGNPANVTAPLAIALSANPPAGFTFHTAAGCGTAGVTGVTITTGNTATFYFRGMTAGMVTMLADSVLDPDPTQVATVGVMPPSQLVYLTPTAQTHTANECSAAVTLEARDSGGNRSNVSSALTVSLAAAPMAGFGFYSDAMCTQPVSSVQMAASSSQVSFYWLGTAAGTVVMTPTSSLAGQPGPQNAIVRPGPASSIAFTTPARTAIAGVCSGAITVQSRDAYGNAAPVTADTVLQLSAATGLTYFLDAACTGPATPTATIAANQSAVTFYAKGTLAPSYNITAQHPSVGMQTQTLTITPAAAAKLVVTSPQQTLSTGQCSSGLTFERRDAFDNAITAAAALTVSLSGPAGVQFFPTGSCTMGTAITTASIPMGSSTVTVFFRSTAAGMPTLTGSNAAVATSGTQVETITLSAPSVLAFLSAPQLMVTAGQVSAAVTLESRDAFGNPSPVSADTPITLSMPPSTFVYCGDAGCVGLNPSVQIAAGASTATFYFRGNIAQTFTITASSSLGSPMQSETVVPAAAAQLVFGTSAQTRSVGSCSTAVTVTRQDAFTNAVTAGTLTVNLVAAPSSGFTFYTAAGCGSGLTTSVSIGPGASSATFYFNGTAPVAVQITASGSGVTSAQQTETLTPVPPDRMVFVASPASVTAGGPCGGPFTLEARDPYGNPAAVGSSAVLVSLSVTAAANGTFYSDAACTASTTTTSIPANGTTASFWFKATGAGTQTITASNAGLGSVQLMLPVNPGAPTVTELTTAPLSVRLQTCSSTPAAFRTLDAFGNPAPVVGSTTFALSESPAGGVTYWADATCTTTQLTGVALSAGQGTGSFYVKGGNTVQMVTVTLTPSVGSIAPVSQVESVISGAPTQLAFTSAAKSVMAGECTGAMTVQSRDATGNPSNVAAATTVTLTGPAGSNLTFFTDTACMTAGTPSIAAGTNTVSFSARGITGGAHLVTATGAGIATPATQTLTVAPMVRTGQCTLANGQTSTGTNCAISPALNADLSKTFFFFQATSSLANLDDTAVRCALTSATLLTCSRGGNTADLTIRWYTVSRPAGLTVQHFPSIAAASGSNATTTQNITAVNPAQAFVLMSTSVASGPTQFTSARWASVRLASATSVEIRRFASPDSNFTHSVQVVEWTGATVERPTSSVNLADATLSTTAPVANAMTDPMFLLYSWRYGQSSNGGEICHLAVRGVQGNPNTIAFSRGLGTAACNADALDIDYERVRLPGHRVDTVSVNIPAASVDAAPVTLGSAVDLTRTVAFFGATSYGGQSMGEASDTTQDRFRDSLARVSFTNDTTVQVSRADPAATGTTLSTWNLYVWQLVP